MAVALLGGQSSTPMCVGIQILWHIVRGQRTTGRSHFSPSPLWDLGRDLDHQARQQAPSYTAPIHRFFFRNVFVYVYRCFTCKHICAHVCRPEKGTRGHGTRVIVGCELLCGCSESSGRVTSAPNRWAISPSSSHEVTCFPLCKNKSFTHFCSLFWSFSLFRGKTSLVPEAVNN